jgi:hypothetical protein
LRRRLRNWKNMSAMSGSARRSDCQGHILGKVFSC